MTRTIRPTVGGTAVVCCVHDREKRSITDLEFDLSATKVHLCACCENLFLERTDEPMFCPTCRGRRRYPLAAPLPNPIGVIHG